MVRGLLGALIVLATGEAEERPVWRVPFESGTGALGLEVADGLLVVRPQGGTAATRSVATGAQVTVLVPRPGAGAVLYGALVGPSGGSVIAIDLRTGKPRWSKAITGLAGAIDPYELRDHLELAAAGGLIVAGIPHLRRDLSPWQEEAWLIALDPASGEERWRRLLQRARDRGLRVRAAGSLVVVETAGRLRGVAAASGAELWATSVDVTRKRLLATADGRVALSAENAREIVVLETGRGQQVLRIPAPTGGARQLGLDEDTVYAGWEDAAPAAPRALVEAIALPAGKARWRQELPYSVAALEVHAGVVYVVAGDGQLRALDRRAGQLRWAMFLGWPRPFAVAPVGPARTRVMFPGGGETTAQIVAVDRVDGASAADPGPYLRWELFEHSSGPGGDKLCGLAALSWLDGAERVVWRRALPDRMRAEPRGPCQEAELSTYRRLPRAHAGRLYGMLGPLEAGGRIWVADLHGVLALDKATGRIALDLPVDRGKDWLFYDSGRFHLSGRRPCQGPSHHGVAFAVCGDEVLYFNGSRAVLLGGDPLVVTARGQFGGERSHGSGDSAANVRARIPMGKRTLMVEGQVYMK